jgi:hypothetical protein
MSEQIDTSSLAYKAETERLAFAHILVDANWLDTAKDVLYYWEKAYKWDDAYFVWLAHGRPTNESPGWDFFIRNLDQQQEKQRD